MNKSAAKKGQISGPLYLYMTPAQQKRYVLFPSDALGFPSVRRPSIMGHHACPLI